MKITRSVIVALVLLILVSALYRIVPNRPDGFAPQYAMAIFGGALCQAGDGDCAGAYAVGASVGRDCD